MTTAYETSSTRAGARRTKAEMELLRSYLYAVVEAQQPMTVRQVFYQMVVAGAIGKTENEYSNAVSRVLTQMRRAGELPYGWITDNTRWQRRPTTWDSIEDALRSTAKTYRRALWSRSPDRVEIWLEKDALAGVLLEVTDPYDVPLMVSRGYSSATYLRSAAEEIASAWLDGEKHTHIYYFGDRDPSGVDITRAVEVTLANEVWSILRDTWWQRMVEWRKNTPPKPDPEFGPARAIMEWALDGMKDSLTVPVPEPTPEQIAWRRDEQKRYEEAIRGLPHFVAGSGMYLFGDDEGPAETMKDVEYGTDDWDYWKEAAGWEEVFTFDLVAVTTDQIEAWDLPTRPTKRSDSRSKKFRGSSVELDAIPPAQLRELCEEVILRHIDHDQIDVLKVAEESEREVLTKIANREVA